MFRVYQRLIMADSPSRKRDIATVGECKTGKATMIKRLLTILTLTTLCSLKLSAADALERGFTHPPDAARPWVYWFWLSGNITSTGIRSELEAMKRRGPVRGGGSAAAGAGSEHEQ